MSYHMFTADDHECPACNAVFVPFEQGLPCPRCGMTSNEFYDYVSEAIIGLRVHKMEYGQYTPHAYLVGNFPEHVFLLLCNAFDSAEEQTDSRVALQQFFNRVNWGDQTYLNTHIYEIALRVRGKLSQSNG